MLDILLSCVGRHGYRSQRLTADDNLWHMPASVKQRIAAERRERPFDSVADLQRRVNASATSMRDRLGKAYLPYLRASAPVWRGAERRGLEACGVRGEGVRGAGGGARGR